MERMTEVDSLTPRRDATDEKKRLEIYHRINKLWIEDAPAAPLCQQVVFNGANKRVAWKPRSDELIKAYDMALKDAR